ncbi:MAG TPA: TetR family transcriptional regulator C-terminal domain-containing protein [Malonomonas sp.]
MTPASAPQAISREEQKIQTRHKLIETTIDIIADEGFTGVTMAKVAERAGLSRGIGNFHFQTKDQLLLEAFRMLYREHAEAWQKAIAGPSSPPEKRLKKLIETLLTPPIADHKKIAVWLAFWGVTPHRQTYLSLCTEGDCQYEDAIADLLREAAAGAKEIDGMSMRAIAVALTAMIDGAHLQYLIAPDRLSSEDAIRACMAFLSSFFPQFRQA